MTLDTIATDFEGRTFQDPGLHRFLQENLGRDPAYPFDFETLSWVAFYFNPTLDNARAHWATTRAARLTAAMRPNPTLSLIPGYNTNNPVGVSPWLPAVTLDFLFTGKKRAHQVEVAEAEMEAARLGVFVAAWQVRSDLRRALIDLEVLEAREKNLGAQETFQSAIYDLLNARVSAGRLGAGDLSVPRLAQLRAAAALADVGALKVAERARVAAALGVPLAALEGQSFPLIAPSAFTPEQIAAARKQALQTRPDVLAAVGKLASAQASLALELERRRPDLHLGPGYQYDQGLNKWTLALTFELPVFNHNEGPIAEAMARRSEAATQLLSVQSQIIGAIDAAVAAQGAAAQQRAKAEKIGAEVDAQAKRISTQLDLGAADELDVKTATLEQAVTASALNDARAAEILATGQLEDALEIPFPQLSVLADREHPQLPLIR